jgi:hypothetical protein
MAADHICYNKPGVVRAQWYGYLELNAQADVWIRQGVNVFFYTNVGVNVVVTFLPTFLNLF